MKKTKIVCTLGPSSSTKKIISAMADAGMDVVRLNFSHGTHEDYAKKIEIIKEIRAEKQIPLPILLDTKGPEFRIGTFQNGKITLKDGDDFIFTTDDIIGDERRVSVSYKKITSVLGAGDKILLNNGLMVFEVKNIVDNDVVCKAVIGGELSNKKSMFFPEKELDLEFLSEQDKNDLLFGIEHGVDFVALSFVSKAQDVLDVREFLNAHGGNNVDIIAKIESRAGVNHLSEIMQIADGVMVARGDLGVEIPYEELPDTQKNTILRCRVYGKRVITATEMLESMIHQPRPTRAEISDVANAVYDGTSAVMLSGETAAGAFPVESVKAMAKIVEQAETHEEFSQMIENYDIKNTGDALSHATCSLAKDLGAKAIVVCTTTGTAARMVSRYHPRTPIVGLTANEFAYRKLALNWGVYPVRSEEATSVDLLFKFAKQAARGSGFVRSGDTIVITGRTPNKDGEESSLINIETV